jgi:hypothetical protein
MSEGGTIRNDMEGSVPPLFSVPNYPETPLPGDSVITLEKLRAFSDRTQTLVTADAPLFGSVMLLNGRVLDKGSAVEPEKIGHTTGFPAPEQIVAEASRFWILLSNGIRERKSREEMARLLEEA